MEIRSREVIASQLAILKTCDRSANAKLRLAGRFCLWKRKLRLGRRVREPDVGNHVPVAIARAGFVHRHGNQTGIAVAPPDLSRIQHACAPVKRTFEKNRVRASRNRLALVVLSVPGVMQRAV